MSGGSRFCERVLLLHGIVADSRRFDPLRFDTPERYDAFCVDGRRSVGQNGFGGRGVGRDPAIHIDGCTSFDAQSGLLVRSDGEGAEFAAFHDRRGRFDGDRRRPLQEHGREEHLRRTGNADPDGERVLLARRRRSFGKDGAVRIESAVRGNAPVHSHFHVARLDEAIDPRDRRGVGRRLQFPLGRHPLDRIDRHPSASQQQRDAHGSHRKHVAALVGDQGAEDCS